MICEFCGEPKTVSVTFCGITREFKALCKCESEKENKERYEFFHGNKVRELTKSCFYPNDLSHKTFENDDNKNSELTKIAKQYVADYEKHKANGRGLLFFGECDVGKSYICACIANALIEKEIAVKMTTFADIASAMEQNGNRKSYMDYLLTFQVLIIDDLNAERDSAYMNEIVYQVINAWTNTNKPLIVTTNITKQELLKPKNIAYNRIYSRLFEKCIPYEVKGEHRRLAQCSEYTRDFLKDIK